MLRGIAVDAQDGALATAAFPRAFGAGLAITAKSQLRLIVDCDQARDVLVKAFLEAALIAEAKQVPKSFNSDSLSPIPV
jgi:hypothetical protein